MDIAPPTDLASPPALQLDSPAPGFVARTTLGRKRLSDYAGKWLVLFSHPADFTPVCTSEFIAFQTAKPAFDAIDCEILGLSVDSIYAHLAWIESIRTQFGVRITFPIIEDVSMAVSYAYGMIHAGSVSTATVRSLFFIDPNGILRAVTHYPMQVGRNIDEILRTVRALQIAQTHNVSLPAGWTPGDKAVRNAPCGLEEMAGSDTDAMWYYQEIDIPGEAAS